jgi:hydrogenase maturation protease
MLEAMSKDSRTHSSIRIVGIGSPHGDDQVGWHAVERLQQESLADTEVFFLANPILVLDHLDGCRLLIIVDACHTGATPGTVFRFVWPDPRLLDIRGGSTHGLGTTNALQLAEALGRLPSQVFLFGVETTECTPNGRLSHVLLTAVVELMRRVVGEVHKFQISTRQESTSLDPKDTLANSEMRHYEVKGRLP